MVIFELSKSILYCGFHFLLNLDRFDHFHQLLF